MQAKGKEETARHKGVKEEGRGRLEKGWKREGTGVKGRV
jgi:hypothetical protein